jgi:hypothetical protein
LYFDRLLQFIIRDLLERGVVQLARKWKYSLVLTSVLQKLFGRYCTI